MNRLQGKRALITGGTSGIGLELARELLKRGNTVIVAEHEMRVAAAADWIIDLGPGAGDEGGRIVVAGTPQTVAAHAGSKTAAYLAPLLAGMSTTRS